MRTLSYTILMEMGSDEPIMLSRTLSDQAFSSYSPAPTPDPDPTPSPGSSSSNSLVIGGSIGGALVLLLASFIGFYYWKKKKNSGRQRISMQLSESPSPPNMYAEDLYIGSYPQPPPPPVDHVVKLSSDTDSTPIPPPPLPGILSSGSVSECSGSEHLPRTSSGMAFGLSISTFTYEELVIATHGFSDANILGEGGFGYVYKAVLPNGKEVAVKQLKSDSRQGDREFQAEVDIISRVHHKHLVSLVGYCISDGQRLLVYEFVPNSTLESHLHGKNRPTMEWSTRLKIALGSAKGLAYLHEDCHPKIIHRDIKAANILIDYNFEAKVADFGLAKFSEDNKTHVSTRVMGTFGYLAPEYASSGKLTDKSDVFSFGIILLELVTGRRPVDMTQFSAYDSLVEWARPILTRAIEDGNYEALVDPTLGKNYNVNEMAHMIICAAACVLSSAKSRPRMSQVVRALEGDTSLEDLTEGVKLSNNQYTNSDNNKAMMEFQKIAMQSSESQSSSTSRLLVSSEGQHKL